MQNTKNLYCTLVIVIASNVPLWRVVIANLKRSNSIDESEIGRFGYLVRLCKDRRLMKNKNIEFLPNWESQSKFNFRKIEYPSQLYSFTSFNKTYIKLRNTYRVLIYPKINFRCCKQLVICVTGY